MQSSFGFTNKDVSTKTIAPYVIHEITDYGKTLDNGSEATYSNKTCPGQNEIISFRAKAVNNISSEINVVNPAKATAPVQYQVRLDEILRTVDDTGNIMFDEPIVMYLTVRHNSSSVITSSHIDEVFKRLIGALTRDNGSFRFDDLMLGALAVTAE